MSSTACGNEITVFELRGLHVSDPKFGWSQGKDIMCVLPEIHYTERNAELI